MNQRKTKKYMGYSGLLVILLIAIDQFTKQLKEENDQFI